MADTSETMTSTAESGCSLFMIDGLVFYVEECIPILAKKTKESLNAEFSNENKSEFNINKKDKEQGLLH